MRVLKVKKSAFFVDKLKKQKIGDARIPQPTFKPVFPFVGNKSNRREWLVELIEKVSKNLLPELPDRIFDLFGGSFYLSHLIQVAAARLGHDITAFTNDYDGYSELFKPETMEHLLWYKSVCDAHPELKRNELLTEDDCQKIDDYTNRNCPHLDPWVIRFLTNYGSSRHYRKRLTDYQDFWKGVSLSDYIPNTTVTLGKVDWKDWIDWIAERGHCDRTKPSLWFVDPPYTTYGTGLYYGDGFDNLDIGLVGIVMRVLRKFPRAYIVTFGYVRNFEGTIPNFPTNLHYDELNEYWPACQGLRVRSRPEYTHIWYIAKHNRALDELLDMDPLIDKQNHGHIRADGKKPNMDAWTYDSKFGSR